MSWRDSLRPASFRGVPFKVEIASKAGGRRGVTFEFPRRDASADEDLGKRARRFAMTGYVIGLDHHRQAADLERALAQKGPGTLVTPLMGSATVRCETFSRTERRQEGGITSFEMMFAESEQSTPAIGEDTASLVAAAASAAAQASVASVERMAASEGALPAPKVPETHNI